MSPRMPEQMTLIWCPVCGVNDRYSNLKMRPGRHYWGGKLCTGDPVELTYLLAHPRLEFVPGTAPLRAALEVVATIHPGLPHLTERGPTRVGQMKLVAANNAEELATLLEAFTDLMVRDIGERVAVHPRPEPIGGWPR